MADTTTGNGFWAVVEIFGHKRFAGFVSEWLFAGETFVRIEIPQTASAGAFAKMFGAKAVYAISPCDEATARAYAEALREKPIDVWIPNPHPMLPSRIADGEFEASEQPFDFNDDGPDDGQHDGDEDLP